MGDVISLKTGKPFVAEKVIKKQTVKIVKTQTIENLGTQKIVRKKIPKRTTVNNPLTEEHRDELNYLVKHWASTSKQAKNKKHHIDFPQAWGNLYSFCLKNEVNGIEQIEESEYLQCVSYLNQKIRIVESRVPKKYFLETLNIGKSFMVLFIRVVRDLVFLTNGAKRI